MGDRWQKKTPQHGLVVADDLPETHFPSQFCRPQDRNQMKTDPRKRLKRIKERDGLWKSDHSADAKARLPMRNPMPMGEMWFAPRRERWRWRRRKPLREKVRGVFANGGGKKEKSDVERRRGNYYLFRMGGGCGLRFTDQAV